MGTLVGCQRCGYKHNLEECPRCNPKNTGLDELEALRKEHRLAEKLLILHSTGRIEFKPATAVESLILADWIFAVRYP